MVDANEIKKKKKKGKELQMAEHTDIDPIYTWLCSFPHAATKCFGPARYPSRQPVIAKHCRASLSEYQTSQ